MARQLALDLALPPARGRDDFLPTQASAAAVRALDAPDGWPQGRLLLIGPAGAGKSHLTAIFAADHDVTPVPATGLRAETVEALLPPAGAVAIEDADLAAGNPVAEQALFHLWNLLPARAGLLLMTARTPPRDWGLLLPDLRSRMDAVAQVRLGPPDEALLAAVLVKLFADRQLSITPEVIAGLVARMDRDLGLARDLVAAIDAVALEEGRSITRKLALEALAALTG